MGYLFTNGVTQLKVSCQEDMSESGMGSLKLLEFTRKGER